MARSESLWEPRRDRRQCQLSQWALTPQVLCDWEALGSTGKHWGAQNSENSVHRRCHCVTSRDFVLSGPTPGLINPPPARQAQHAAPTSLLPGNVRPSLCLQELDVALAKENS